MEIMEEKSRRRYSAEDVNFQLKSAASQTVEVFVAYARESSVRPREPTAGTVESPGALAVATCSIQRRPCELSIAPIQEATIPEVPSPPLLSPTSAVDNALEAAGVCPRPRSLSTSQVDTAAVVMSAGPVACTRPSTADAQEVARRLIAIGDSLDTSSMESLLEAANAGVPLHEIVEPVVRELTWENVVKLFRTAYRLIEQHYGKPTDDGWWAAFDGLWNLILTHVSRWILQRGGWSALLSASPIPAHHYTPPTSPTTLRDRSMYSISESDDVEGDELASTSELSYESSPANRNLQDSGVLLNGSHDALDTQEQDDHTPWDHFERHRSRSLPPNRRERRGRRSLRQSLDSAFVFRGALKVYSTVVEFLQK